MIDRIRDAVRDVSEVGFARCERGREDDRVNVLPVGQFQRIEKASRPYSLGIEEHRGHARRCS